MRSVCVLGQCLLIVLTLSFSNQFFVPKAFADDQFATVKNWVTSTYPHLRAEHQDELAHLIAAHYDDWNTLSTILSQLSSGNGNDAAGMDKTFLEVKTGLSQPGGLKHLTEDGQKVQQLSTVKNWVTSTYPHLRAEHQDELAHLIAAHYDDWNAISTILSQLSSANGTDAAGSDKTFLEFKTGLSQSNGLKHLAEEAQKAQQLGTFKNWVSQSYPNLRADHQAELAHLITDHYNDWSTVSTILSQLNSANGTDAAGSDKTFLEFKTGLSQPDGLKHLTEEAQKEQQFANFKNWVSQSFPSLRADHQTELAHLITDHYNDWSTVSTVLSQLNSANGVDAAGSDKTFLALKTALNEPNGLKRLAEEAQKEQQFANFKNWVAQSYPSLRADHQTELAHLIADHYNDWSTVSPILSQLNSANGTDAAGSDKTFLALKTAINEPDGLKRLGEEAQKEQQVTNFKNWIAQNYPSLRVDHQAELARLFADHMNDWSMVSTILSQLSNVNGTDVAGMDETFVELRDGLKDNKSLQELSRNTADAYRNYQQILAWASSIKPNQSRELAAALLKFPIAKAQQVMTAVSGIKGEKLDHVIESIINNKTDKGSDLSLPYYEWVIGTSNGHKTVTGCTEKDALKSDIQSTVSVDKCSQNTITNYDWIDEKSQKCGTYTDSGALIGSADKEKCSNTIAKDIAPFLKPSIARLVFTITPQWQKSRPPSTRG